MRKRSADVFKQPRFGRLEQDGLVRMTEGWTRALAMTLGRCWKFYWPRAWCSAASVSAGGWMQAVALRSSVSLSRRGKDRRWIARRSVRW